MPIVTLVECEKVLTGRTRLNSNNSLFNALIKDFGVGLVQFKAATRPEMKKREENKELAPVSFLCNEVDSENGKLNKIVQLCLFLSAVVYYGM